MREHMASENVHDFDTTIGTFGHPRYELIATGEVYDGEDAVRGYYAESRSGSRTTRARCSGASRSCSGTR